jgi:hypothetical protein
MIDGGRPWGTFPAFPLTDIPWRFPMKKPTLADVEAKRWGQEIIELSVRSDRAREQLQRGCSDAVSQGMRHEDVAAAVGVGPQTVSRWFKQTDPLLGVRGRPFLWELERNRSETLGWVLQRRVAHLGGELTRMTSMADASDHATMIVDYNRMFTGGSITGPLRLDGHGVSLIAEALGTVDLSTIRPPDPWPEEISALRHLFSEFVDAHMPDDE